MGLLCAYDRAVRGRFLVLSFVAACYSPTLPVGAPCSSLGTCPDGLVCTTAGRCALSAGELPPPDGPAMTPDGTIDTDGDGVPDDVDNCPGVKNADQADEDGDKVGDECDGCPQIADAAQADSDGDHIGDACDPNPGAADSRWRFDGFHTGQLPEWGKSSGWAALADGLQVSAPNNNPNDLDEYLTVPIIRTGRIFDKFSVAMTTVVTGAIGSGSEHDVEIMIYDANLKRLIYCELQQQQSGSRFLTVEEWDDSNKATARSHKDTAYPWTIGMTYLLTFVRKAKNYTCTLTGPEGTKSVPVTSDVTPSQEPDVGAFGAVAQIGSVLVVGSP
jgi:hypothetical protein